MRDQLTAVRRVAATLHRMRTAARRSGVVLAPDVDDRFVQAFACAGGRVVGRRRLPRAGDAALELPPLIASLRAALPADEGPLSPEQSEQARIVSAGLVRPGLATRPLAVDRFSVATAAERIARLRSAVPLRT